MEVPGIVLSTLVIFFHLIFKHIYKIDIIDDEKVVHDDMHQAVPIPVSETKLPKSKLLLSEENILLGCTSDNVNPVH